MKCNDCGEETKFTVEPYVYVCNDCMNKRQEEEYENQIEEEERWENHNDIIYESTKGKEYD